MLEFELFIFLGAERIK